MWKVEVLKSGYVKGTSVQTFFPHPTFFPCAIISDIFPDHWVKRKMYENLNTHLVYFSACQCNVGMITFALL